ncbi:MAG: hypothetical protein ABIP95_12720 [Pelobium sp.]
MNEKILEKINQEFDQAEREFVISELSSITLNHVMAASEYNLNNTLFSILKLAKGNTDEVTKLTEAAKFDFRDVIMWAIQEK